jgi:heme-degrading monooxygenase HmoA
MANEQVILRRWRGTIRTQDRETYVAYVLGTGGDDYAGTPGNLGFQVLYRDRGDGTTEVTTLSWWESMETIRGFAGDDPELARYYPEDDRFLLDHPKVVEHHVVAAGRVSVDVEDGENRR